MFNQLVRMFETHSTRLSMRRFFFRFDFYRFVECDGKISKERGAEEGGMGKINHFKKLISFMDL